MWQWILNALRQYGMSALGNMAAGSMSNVQNSPGDAGNPASGVSLGGIIKAVTSGRWGLQ